MCERGIPLLLEELRRTGLPDERLWRAVADGFGSPPLRGGAAGPSVLLQSCPVCGQQIPVVKRVLESVAYNLPDAALYQRLVCDAPCLALGVVTEKTTGTANPDLTPGLSGRWQGAMWHTFGVAFVAVVDGAPGQFAPDPNWGVGPVPTQFGEIADNALKMLGEARRDGRVPHTVSSRETEAAVEAVLTPEFARFGFRAAPRTRIPGYWCFAVPDGVYTNGHETIALEVKVTEDWEHPVVQPFRCLMSHNAVLKLRLPVTDCPLTADDCQRALRAEQMLDASGRAACLTVDASPGEARRFPGVASPSQATRTDQCALCGHEDPIPVRERGWHLLTNPRLNKGSAFTAQERDDLGIEGLLPPHIATLEEHMAGVHQSFLGQADALNQHVYLRSLQDRNETLFYATLLAHLEEYMPVIYTPTVATAVQQFSHIFRATRGIYVSPENIDEIDVILDNIPCHDVAIIVATDNEGILGIGDQGVGGMGIPIGKLSLYTAAGGLCPSRCLPVCLDVGTENQTLLDDPLYLGYRAPRLPDEQYYPFLDKFVDGIRRHFPQAILQWEDFSRDRAFEVLRRYREQHPSFNDDVQGTAAMVHAATLGALKTLGQRYRDQNFVVLGAGAAGAGIARSTVRALVKDGLTEAAAWQRLYVLDSRGLVTSDRAGLDEYKQALARDPAEVAGWTLEGDRISLYDVIVNAKPTVMYGLSGHPGTIEERMVRAMSAYCDHPIIFPMSNPTANCEAVPADLLTWSDGRAIVATGSPFAPVDFGGRQVRFSQANNVAVFPGVGLGAMFCEARIITPEMLFVAGEALHTMTEADDYAEGLVLPPNRDLRETAVQVATAVAAQAWAQGVARRERPDGDLSALLRETMYVPRYRPYVPA